MVRTYKRKPKRIDPDKRMTRAVELRALGLSNYQIAERLLCSEGTVRNDLKRWNREHPNAVPLVRKTTAQNIAPGATDYAADYAAEPTNIISLDYRRKRA